MSLVRIDGIDAVRRVLKEVAPQEARKLMRDTVQDIAKEVAEDAKTHMRRDSGDMIRGTYARKEPMQNGNPLSTVRVRGAFYWRFREYGQGPDHVEDAMFFKARERMLSILDQQFLNAFARRLVARLKRG